MAPSPAVNQALSDISSGTAAAELEGLTLDFKRAQDTDKGTARDIAQAAACLANARGGSIVLGVADRPGGPGAFVGTNVKPEWLSRQIFDLTEPRLSVDVEAFEHQGALLLEIRVPTGVDVFSVGGKATKRRDESCVTMSANEIARLADERRGIDWSATETGRKVADTSPVALSQARSLLRMTQDPTRRGYGQLSDADLLRALGVATADGALLRAGELIFCESEGEEIVTYQFRKTPGGEPQELLRLGCPLLSAVLRVLEAIEARVDKTPLLLTGGQQVELSGLPVAAVRECVVNALVHRDYRLPGPVQIEHAPAQIVVTSPGPLVSGVTVDNILTTPSRPRNSKLTAAVRTLGLAEQAGVGVDRMYREMLRLGHRPPQITEDSGMVRVALLGGTPSKPIARFVAGLPQEYADDADTMLVLFYLLTSKTVTAQKLAPIVQKPEDETLEVLRRLAADEVKLLEPTRESSRRRSPTYRLRDDAVRSLGAEVSYQRRTTDEIDRKVISLVNETGTATGKLVQLMLDVDVNRASRILGDLVQRQVLKKTSSAQRGPTVTYGPGPKFPKGRTRSRPTGIPNDDAGDSPRLPFADPE